MYVARLAVALLFLFGLSVSRADAQSSCVLAPVFALFRHVAGADIIGECTGQSSVTVAGDLTQPTSRGSLVFRPADTVAAFTDGTTTWVYGPEGLQSRPNADRFAWEPSQSSPATILTSGQGAATPTIPAAPAATVVPTATAVATPASLLTPTLAARCSNVSTSVGMTAGMQMGPGNGETVVNAINAMNQMCREIADKYGAPGVDCFEPAIREALLPERQLAPGNGAVATNALAARLQLCLGGLPR